MNEYARLSKAFLCIYTYDEKFQFLNFDIEERIADRVILSSSIIILESVNYYTMS